MAIPTHLVEDITSTMGLKSYIGPDETLYRFEVPLRSMDGVEYFARVISKLPQAGWPEDFTADELIVDTFLQVGGSAEQLTIDIRLDCTDGVQRLYKLGHSEGARDEHLDVDIRLGENVEHVHASEVFSPVETAEIFFYYYEKNTIPEGFALRELKL